MFLPKTYAITYYELNNVWHYAAYLPKGEILGASPISTSPRGGARSKFKHLDMSRVPGYYWRIQRLQFALHSIVDYGLSDKVYKLLKRLNLVAFTCTRLQLSKLTNKISQLCRSKSANGKIRIPSSSRKTAREYPSFIEETKSISKLNGISVQLWTWKSIAKSVEAWSDQDYI